MKVKIVYQSKRAFYSDKAWEYLEDGRTPADRVERLRELSESNIPDNEDEMVFVTACPYITEAILRFFKKRDEKIVFEFEIDGQQVADANCIFKLFADPMQKLFFA